MRFMEASNQEGKKSCRVGRNVNWVGTLLACVLHPFLSYTWPLVLDFARIVEKQCSSKVRIPMRLTQNQQHFVLQET